MVSSVGDPELAPWSRAGSAATVVGAWHHCVSSWVPLRPILATVDHYTIEVKNVTALVNEFLAQHRIAVVGVSRKRSGHGANAVYRRLRGRGYAVFAVNPNADKVEGDRAYPDLRSIPGGVDAVVIGTAPAYAEAIVHECDELGITRVWMHQGLQPGSVSPTAAAYCRDRGISVIAGSCPLMYGPTADFSHRCIRWYLERTGAIPKENWETPSSRKQLAP